jgi:hypothetical protein
MLIQFRVKNYRSFADEQTFTFSSTADTSHATSHCRETGMKAVRRLSKVAVIFGHNGSGKTNFIKALATMRDLVLHSTTFSDAEFAGRFTPFGSQEASPAGTEFEIDLLLGKIRYRYGFSYGQSRVLAEQLSVYCTGKPQRWFERVWDESARRNCWLPFSPSLTGPRAMWRDATRERSLFLTAASQLNAEPLRPLYEWFEHGMELILTSTDANLASVANAVADDAFKVRMLDFLHSADIGVDDIRVPSAGAEERRPTGYWNLPNKASARNHSGVEFLHSRGGSAVWLPASDESAGIQRLAGLFGPLAAAIAHGKLLLIDEFDLSLHPLVARFLISLLNDPMVSGHGAQLVLTSHNTTLMDLNFMRRDEIWLMSLTGNRASRLSPIWQAPVPPRKRERVGNAYLRGRYGAVPQISPLQANSMPIIVKVAGARKSRVNPHSRPAAVDASPILTTQAWVAQESARAKFK